MRFSFEVGQHEKHQVDFAWSKFFGVAKIWVDGDLVLKSRPLAFQELAQASRLASPTGSARYLAGMANGTRRPQMTRGWSFEVGQVERHMVHIEKERPLILAALRPHTYRIFVDEQFVQEHVG